MAGACSIIRNPNDPSIIDFVEAPNGSRSVLFDDLRERTDQDQALNLWLTSKTKKFRMQVTTPALNSHRIKLMSRVGNLGPKVSSVQIGGKTVTLDNMDFTNFEVDDIMPGPKGRSTFTLKAFGFPEGGGQGVQVGRIRYRVSGNEMVVESSTLTNVGSSTVKPESQVKQELREFLEPLIQTPEAPNMELDEYGRISDDSTVHLYHSTMSREDAANFEGIDFDKQTAVKGVFFSKLGSPYRDRTPYVIIETKGKHIPFGSKAVGAEVAISQNIPSEVIYRSTLSPEEQGSAKFFLDNMDRGDFSEVVEAIPRMFRENETLVNDLMKIVKPEESKSINGLGIGSGMYGELFKVAMKQGMTVVSSDNLSPSSRALWNKMVDLNIAVKDGERYRLNMYPPGFDNNGEPSMAKVIDFTDREGVGANITMEEELEILDTMVGLPVEDSQAMLTTLKRGFMPDGYFKPTRSSLMMTGLYTSPNITEIMMDENLQQRIREFIYKLEKLDKVYLNDMYVDDAYNVVEDGSKTAIGTYKLRNPFIVQKEVIERLGGIQDRARFEELLYTDDVQEIVGDSYAAFKGTQTDLFYTMKKYRTADEVLIDENGIVPRMTGAFEGMYETLGKVTTKQLEKDADLLQSLDDVMWIENPKMADDLLGSVQNELQKIGMDIENLPQIAKINGIEDTKDFLRAARDFAQNDSRDTFNTLVEAYETLYDIKSFFMEKKVPLPQTVKSGNIVATETDMTGPEAFVAASIVPVAPGVYKRVQPVSVDQMLEAMYEYRLKSNGYEGILPDKALYPAAYDADGTINMAKVQDPANKTAILNSMKAWTEAEVGKLYTEGLEADMETLQTYVLMFNYYNRSDDYSKFDNRPTMAEDYQSLVTPVTNLDYLLGDFIEDFNLKMLSEKRKNSDIYKNFYSNFKITANGIELVSNDPISMRRIEPYLEENQNLVNYFRAHKNKPELMLDIAPEQQIIDDLFRRNYYSNYPTALKPFTGEYTPIRGGTMAAKVKHPFVRLSDGVYELVMGVGRFGIYQKLETNRGPIKRYDPQFRPPALDASPRHLESISGTVNTTLEIKNLYDQNEERDIDDKYDCR